MTTYFCPMERCTIEQAYQNSEFTKLVIRKEKEGHYAVYDNYNQKIALLEVEAEWIRGGYRYGETNSNQFVLLSLSKLTNCGWVDEYNHEAMQVYLFWDHDEILVEAQSCIDDRILVDPDDEWGTHQQEWESQVDYLYSRRVALGVGSNLPLAEPITMLEMEGLKQSA